MDQDSITTLALLVRIERCATTAGEFDCITTLVLADLHLRCDLVRDRKIRLAHRIAVEHGAPFIVQPQFEERVAAVLAKISCAPAAGIDQQARHLARSAPFDR